jgi:hypothetical protein
MDFESATERMMSKMGDAANAWEAKELKLKADLSIMKRANLRMKVSCSSVSLYHTMCRTY